MASGSPDWPERTADISEIGIDMHFTPASGLGKLFSEISGSASTLTVRIVDYPGEWLLDLPLLEQILRRMVARDAARSAARAFAPKSRAISWRSSASTRPDDAASEEVGEAGARPLPRGAGQGAATGTA